MKVAMVSEHASPLAVLGGPDAGGQNVHVAALAQGVGKLGCEVTVYTRRDDAALPRRVRFAPGVIVEHIDAGPARHVPKDDLLVYMDEFADNLRRAWERNAPDVVHSHFWMSGRAALAATVPRRIPLVHTFHALGVVKHRHQGSKDTSPTERVQEERRLIAGADAIIATCTDEVFELKRMGADSARVFIVPCGVDLSRFRPDGPAEARSRHTYRLVVVTRLVERKGVGNVISALARIPDTELIVAGGPERPALARDPEARRLLALASALGVGERVELRGRVARDDVPPLMRSADAVVSVPWYEPFGIVPLEAMACGVPVVASAVGGMIDTVVHGRTGVHVPPRSPRDLAEVLNRLLGDEGYRRNLGANGARRARSRYGWDRVTAGTVDVYRHVLSHSRAQAAEART
jgi:D-inositol-3-phosphate glycosyltransferase